jgi:glutamine amidotransferase
MYHVHTYYVNPHNLDYVLSFSSYNNFQYCSTVQKKNIFGCQYHPEKSGVAGLSVIKNFMELA